MIAWVVTSYTVITTASTLVFGRLGDIVGNIRVLKWGMILFTAASLLCGLAPGFGLLIAARMIQGLGAGAMFANNHGIITRLYPQEMRGRALGINAAFVALGNLAGPSLGGLLLSVSGWQILFLINVPVGIAAAAAQHFYLPKQWHANGEKLDYTGAALFAVFISTLFIALQQLQAWGLLNPVVLSCLAAAVIAFVLFITVQRKSEFPMLDLRIFRNKWFSVSLFCGFTSFIAIGGFNFVFPFYLQQILLFTPIATGLFMSIYPLVLVTVSPVSGWLTDRFGPEILSLAGGNQYKVTDISGEAEAVEKPAIKTGFLENSRVQIAQEMVNMIEASKGFSFGSKVVQTADEMEKVINQLR
jgi:EmrB/QacA subfamily drug resistance transporter